MKIIKLAYRQSIQAAQYCPIDITAEAILNEGEHAEAAMAELKRFVTGQLDLAVQDYQNKLKGVVKQESAPHHVQHEIPAQPVKVQQTQIDQNLEAAFVKQQSSPAANVPALPSEEPTF